MHSQLQPNEAEFVPESIVEPLNFKALFAEDSPVEIDLGFGDGSFLVALARQNPSRNFLGVERLRGRVRSVCRKAANLPNVRILRMEVSYFVAHLAPAESIAAVHFLFPDPWPKRRHIRRRTFTSNFLKALHRVLIPRGLLHIATDHADYFARIESIVADEPIFVPAGEVHEFPQTGFEKRFAANGSAIYRLLLRKVSPVK